MFPKYNLTYVHLLMLVLASWRIVELFLQDRITDKLRKKFPSYIWQCPRCMSVWTSIFTVTAFIVYPWINWIFGVAWIYLFYMDTVIMRRGFKKGREFNIAIQNDGTYQVKNELSEQELQNIFVKIFPPPPGVIVPPDKSSKDKVM